MTRPRGFLGRLPGGPGESLGRPPGDVQARDFSLLPADRAFRDLLPAFVLPYLAYVALGGLLPGLLGPDLTQAVRLLVVGGLLLSFRRTYAFGPVLKPSHYLIALGGAAAATALWMAVLRLDLSLPFWRDRLEQGNAAEFSLLYWVLRTLNSVLLVPIFEELFCRVFVQELAQSPSSGTASTGAAAVAKGRTALLDRHPSPLALPPFSARAIGIATLVFTIGHDMPSWLPATLYFLLTTALYAYTRSLRVCILIHALTNLTIAALVWLRPDMRFLWF